jgi:hypothetical protein
MWARTLRQLFGWLVIGAYTAATVVAAASPFAACPTLGHAHHAGPAQGIDHTHHYHHDGSGSHPGDCLNCCMGTCLLGASLPPPSTSASLLAFYGTPVVYASEQSVLSDHSILPDPGPPKPIA